MREFPAQFGGGGYNAPNQYGGYNGPNQYGGSPGNWNPNAMCDGKRAQDRADWLVQNQRLDMYAAQNQVMREFPAQFGGANAPNQYGGYNGPNQYGGSPGSWNPNAMCDGKRAQDRADWLVQNRRLDMYAAQNQVMREFPAQFRG